MAKSYPFTNKEVAKLLTNLATAYEILGENRFRISAYQEAAVSVEHSSIEIKDLWDDQKLQEIPGIGKNLEAYLDELFRTGKVVHFQKIFKKIPAAVFVFLDIPGIGPKTAMALAVSLKINSAKDAIKKLKKNALEKKIRVLDNFGERSEEEILEGIKSLEKGERKSSRMLLFKADEISSEIISYLTGCGEVNQADVLGSLRRKAPTIGDIDISVSTDKPKKVIEFLLKYPKIKTILSKGETKLVRLVLFSGHQVDIRLSNPNQYGSMLQYFTGSKHHNILLREFGLRQGLSLSEYGIIKLQTSKIKSFKTEKSFYKFLGLDWIPPEIREGTSEIIMAKNGNLPNLVDLTDIRGDLHLHTNFNIEPSHDLGESSVEEILYQAISLGYDYLGFSEHNPSVSGHSENEINDLIKRKKEFIDKYMYSNKGSLISRVNNLPIAILHGLEVDIQPNGNLAVDEKGLAILDYAIASVHSSFRMSRADMTKRIITGLSHPKVKFLGHPTGRLLEGREGYEIDWDMLFDFCLKNNKFLEISAWPNRLDLPDVLVNQAVKSGVKLIVNSDSHHVDQMRFMKYGVSVARRGWAEKKDIINTLSFDQINAILLKK